MTGELQTNRETVKFIYQIRTQSEQQYWKKLDHMVQAKLEVKKVEPIARPRNPGEFNYAKYLIKQNIYYQAEITEFKNLLEYHPQSFKGKINVLRIHIIKYLAQLPKWLRIHAQSLIVGYTAPTDKDFLKILSVLGVIHLFSLSGLHVLLILTLIRKLTSFLKIPLELIDMLMLFLLPSYGILVGSKSGIWRAVVLAMVGIVFKKLGWSLSSLDIFSVTLLICLFVDPMAITTMGGQLSFLLAFAIMYLYKHTKFIWATLKMNLVSLPIICFYTYQLNWLTLLINLIFIPLFTYVILPLTFISALSVNLKIWNNINNLFEIMYRILDYFSSNVQFILVTGKLAVLSVVLLVIISIFYIESKSIFNKYLYQYLIIFVGCVVFNKFPLSGSVNIIDVGQGDSILVTTPLIRKTFLIDTAGKLKFMTKPWAKRNGGNQVEHSTIPFLKSQGISKIDKLFLSHKDVDHIGNLEILLNKFPVKQVNFGIGLDQNLRIQKVIRAHPEIEFRSRRQGDVIKTGFINWQVLWPKVKGKGENSDSLTLLAQIKNKKWLFTGDLDIPSEQKILKDYQFKVDYLKLGHHGSKTATGDELLEKTQPQLGLISSGVNNRYGHPNRETLQRLENHHVKYLNTADYGMISWYYDFFDNREKITTFLKGDSFENSRIKK
ncbi:DNA internalization-related competence protein ComEC/Rec2 [Companilactobacillus paralimentarius]|uniref:ComE operon protein n=1 Tax=Companilactobacillus kimchii TaxID=2801452 RepID=A0A210P8B4_9LACO|nr:hypothetical protein ATN91_07040 [Companilactobacillus kimchii]OWF32714.1 ComE operon protein [Companilactobacillus kimchii]GEO47682.1 DNA internalization-related competence protein ComEC/Rec2 [Companilactobacillus paralimentarius]